MISHVHFCGGEGMICLPYSDGVETLAYRQPVEYQMAMPDSHSRKVRTRGETQFVGDVPAAPDFGAPPPARAGDDRRSGRGCRWTHRREGARSATRTSGVDAKEWLQA